jgi:hypothetical protein
MNERWQEELELLREYFPELEYSEHGGEHWCRLPSYPVTGGKFRPESVEVAFRIPPRPGEPPYAFWVRPAVEAVNGGPIQNYTNPAPTAWGSDWAQFSWSPLEWVPKADVGTPPNMLTFVRSFADRFEGP